MIGLGKNENVNKVDCFRGECFEEAFAMTPPASAPPPFRTSEAKSHFRFYASSMGRFLKPDNIIPNITNPQNWNAYTYVKGNPVNFNDPSGHDSPDAVQQSVKTETSANVSNPPHSTDNNNEQMKKKLTDQPKKVDVDKTIAQLVATGQVGSFRISSDVQKALQNNPAFRKGFEAWLTTRTGQTQFQQMSSDKNTTYSLKMANLSGRGKLTSGYTLVDWFSANNKGQRTGGADYRTITIFLSDDFKNIKNDSWLLADTLGHEGFHAENWGSGKYTAIGASKRDALLDRPDSAGGERSYWKMAQYQEELVSAINQ